MVIAINTVKVAVEQQSQIVSVNRFKFQMLLVGKGDYLIFYKHYFLVVYFQRYTSASYPDKFVKALFFLQSFVCVIRIGKNKLTF